MSANRESRESHAKQDAVWLVNSTRPEGAGGSQGTGLRPAGCGTPQLAVYWPSALEWLEGRLK